MMVESCCAESIEQVQEAVRQSERLLPFGGRTKTALLPADDRVTQLDLRALSGIVEYEPSEFTITALAGTRIDVLQAALAEHRQYLPFDPLLVAAGATLGGTVASGISGPGRYRYGGLRDFVIGTDYIDGSAQLVHGGGRVVKNAAGFDLAKLMVGSLGRLGVLVQISLKVFPQAEAQKTCAIDVGELTAAVEILTRLMGSNLELDAIELEPPGRLVVRLTGEDKAMAARVSRLRELVGNSLCIMDQAEALQYWQKINRFTWMESPRTVSRSNSVSNSEIVKIPLTPQRIVGLDGLLAAHENITRRYSVAGNVAWLAWPTTESDLCRKQVERALLQSNLSGVMVLGQATTQPLLNMDLHMAERVKQALDPQCRFPEYA